VKREDVKREEKLLRRSPLFTFHVFTFQVAALKITKTGAILHSPSS